MGSEAGFRQHNLTRWQQILCSKTGEKHADGVRYGLQTAQSHRVAAHFAQLHGQVTQVGEVLGTAPIQQSPDLQQNTATIQQGPTSTVYALPREEHH